MLFGLVGLAGSARANPDGIVPAPDARVLPEGGEVVLHADYAYAHDSSHITREHLGPGASDTGPLPVRRELDYTHVSHTITPGVDLGIYHDVFLSFSAPIIVSQTTELDLAPGASRDTSSTFTDGILPKQGFDARDPTVPPGGNLMFRDVARAGVPELRLGLGLAPMNQARDATKPTWKLGAELRLSVGKVQRFDPVTPSAQEGVATGVHELKLWTTVDRRFRYFEGYFEAFYQVPIVTRDASLFHDPGFGSTNVDPGQTAGGAFGLEAYLVNDAATGNQVSIDVGSKLTAHFEGRGYTEMWQIFALAGDPRLGGPLVLDADPTADGVQAMRYPGISNYEGYLESAARLAIRAKLGRHVQFAATGALAWKTQHAISFADGGVDLPTCPKGAPACETDNNDVINPGTKEVNPVAAKLIDQVGHRYIARDNVGYTIGVEAQLVF
ncbi:MAG TPA: hypothetical protein VGC42_05445 [Kofleriaceae bacterium]